MGDIGTFKVRYMGYFGTPWRTLTEELQGQMSARLYRTCISVTHVTYKDIQRSIYENQPAEGT